jgi:hypothetical protein
MSVIYLGFSSSLCQNNNFKGLKKSPLGTPGLLPSFGAFCIAILRLRLVTAISEINLTTRRLTSRLAVMRLRPTILYATEFQLASQESLRGSATHPYLS